MSEGRWYKSLIPHAQFSWESKTTLKSNFLRTSFRKTMFCCIQEEERKHIDTCVYEHTHKHVSISRNAYLK